ncbi:MAG: hypothetical protein JSV96_10955 [Candidatus Aminicenantes bacterium]|nr:MAG: hypothetical protein JSV96_10955 [Candidatus Aminicenantes bacterium]
MTEPKPLLPKTVGLWTRADSPKFVDAQNIFDYMDGAGELYVGYRFDHLEYFEYKAKTQEDILVELYFMKTSDDSYGLLSLDWGGEPMDLSQSPIDNDDPRALYGEGLLRLWSDNIYARIMAYQETPESRQTVLTLGRSVVQGRNNPNKPALLKNLPDSLPSNWTLRKDRASYFRSHLVLNSIYYLGQENILELDHTSEAVTALYERKTPSGEKILIRFLLVEYSENERARNALTQFHRAYLPEHPFPKRSDHSGKISNVYSIEDGWMGYKLQNSMIAFIFECPDQETARTIIEQL